ncbi:MAG: T9SS type A sorting domain-containing protein, partial [Bacteroidia bacterium]|nr:T9SS type A sorting domain-containing protein [Bacteroidia bacterium]
LYQSGTYYLQITTFAGCIDKSEPIDINFIQCGGCQFSGNIKVDCGPVSEMGNQTYSLSFTFNNSLGAGANVNITSSNGIISSLSPSLLASGINTVTANFEDIPPQDSIACFTIIIFNKETRCDTTICTKLPPCGQKDCKISPKITEFTCIGLDGSGNPQYYVCMNINWSGSSGSTLTLSAPSSSFSVNPVTINNGPQSLCWTYTDLSPTSSFITIYLYAFDPVTGLVCKDSIKTQYKPCSKDSCSIGVYGECAHCHQQEGGIWTYDIDLTVLNPFAGPATVTIPPIAAGTFGPITPNPIASGMQTISCEFTDLSPTNSIICFKVLLTEVSTGKTCWRNVCIALPPCDSNVSILVNTVEQFNLMVYPNPANNSTHINYQFTDQPNQLSFDLMDVNGRIIKSINTQQASGDLELDLSSVTDGLYFIRVYKDGRVVGNTRLLVMHEN